MNVDALANYPRWTTYFFVAVPVFVVAMAMAITRKQLKGVIENSPEAIAGLLRLICRFRRKSKIFDEECQISSPIADPRYDKPFIDAILSKNNARVKHLLDLGIAEANFHDGKMTGLQYAATAGNEVIVQHLLANGSNVNAEAEDDGGRTALQAASEGGHLAVVDLLLEKGATVNAGAAGIFGRTALQVASAGGHLAVVERLRRAGATR